MSEQVSPLESSIRTNIANLRILEKAVEYLRQQRLARDEQRIVIADEMCTSIRDELKELAAQLVSSDTPFLLMDLYGPKTGRLYQRRVWTLEEKEEFLAPSPSDVSGEQNWCGTRGLGLAQNGDLVDYYISDDFFHSVVLPKGLIVPMHSIDLDDEGINDALRAGWHDKIAEWGASLLCE